MEIINWIINHIGLVAGFISSATIIIVAVTKSANAIISAVDKILDNKLKRLIS